MSGNTVSFNAGIEAAAALVQKQAEDYKQMREQCLTSYRDTSKHFVTHKTKMLSEAKSHKQKQEILESTAKRIRELRVE